MKLRSQYLSNYVSLSAKLDFVTFKKLNWENKTAICVKQTLPAGVLPIGDVMSHRKLSGSPVSPTNRSKNIRPDNLINDSKE